MHSPTQFLARLCRWFSRMQRDLPWRADYAPYDVWISEVMLQQTQMDRAVDYFKRWTARFPDPASVARADEDELLKYWEGLGYYSRARNLRAAAKRMVEEHGGQVPGDMAALEALPGIGPYTSRAIMAVAFNQPVLPIDANVERVLARVLDLDQPVKHRDSRAALKGAAQGLAQALEPGQPRCAAQALMELGALVCAKAPQCESCPVADMCRARQAGRELERPVPGKTKDVVRITMATGVLRHQGRVFIQKRLPGDVWAGLWEFPGGVLEQGETPRQALVREFREETGFRVEPKEKIGTVRYAYTKYRVTMHGYYCDFEGDSPREPVLSAASRSLWVLPGQLGERAFPAGHRKLMALLPDRGGDADRD